MAETTKIKTKLKPKAEIMQWLTNAVADYTYQSEKTIKDPKKRRQVDESLSFWSSILYYLTEPEKTTTNDDNEHQ